MRAHGRDPSDLSPRHPSYSVVARHVYLHVPFCARRCSYCDFSIAVRREVPVDEYLGALAAELETRFGRSPAADVDTLYLGGGTPSRLGGPGVAAAVELLRRRFSLVRGGELTLEANPDDVTPAAAEHWAAAGVTRVSLGSQSFDDGALAWMHRTHDAAAIGGAVKTLRDAGIVDLSLDLIFALPDALQRDFGRDVDHLLALEPSHVSLYGLTVEPDTALGKWVARGATGERPEEGYEREYLEAHARLTGAGFEHYEVSNYARPGHRARHNAAYWAAVPYVGIGPAAHGFDGDSRRWNVRAYAAWRDAAVTGRDPIEGSERLTLENRLAESVYLGLRSDSGLLIEPAERRLVAAWVEQGWAMLDESGRLRCTALGWLRLDSLAAALTHHRSR